MTEKPHDKCARYVDAKAMAMTTMMMMMVIMMVHHDEDEMQKNVVANVKHLQT